MSGHGKRQHLFWAHYLELAGYGSENPLDDEELLKDYQVFNVELSRMTEEALKPFGLDRKVVDRCKNMFALGLTLWLYSRPLKPTIDWLSQKFASKPELRDANVHVLKNGYPYGETTGDFIAQ